MLHKFILTARIFLYKKNVFQVHKLPGLTVSIGNVTIGGTGKSPTTIWLAQFLQNQGFKVVVLTRGYGSYIKNQEFAWFHNGHIKITRNRLNLLCDEPIMISHQAQTDVVVGISRKRAAQWYCSFQKKPDIWILDDGFQHLKIKKDLEILLVDAKEKLGNKNLLPSGPLRDLPSSIKKSDLLLFTRSQSIEPLNWCGLEGFPVAAETELLSLDKKSPLPHSTPIFIVSGIARPERFAEQVSHKHPHSQIKSYFVGDHEPFAVEKIHTLLSKEDAVITTWKDYYRDPKIFMGISNSIYIANLKWIVPKPVEELVLQKINSRKSKT